MPLHRLLEAYEAQSAKCRSLGELFGMTEAASRELGFEFLALVHPLSYRTPSADLVKLENYGSFGEKYREARYYRDDPALLACQRTNKPFAWSRLGGLIKLGPRQKAVLDDAARHGLRSGMTLPVSVIGEPAGSCSFGTASRDLPSRWHCHAATLIGMCAFHEARRLCGYPARTPPLPDLSPRKSEVLRLAAAGKTDPEIAMILGLTRATIETYMRQLRDVFDVYTRTQVCIAALRFGLVAFDDARI